MHLSVYLVAGPLTIQSVAYILTMLQGDEIHAVCKADQLKSLKADLKENSTFVMHNFKMIKNDGQFRVCQHQYKLVFTGVTVIRQCNLDDLPYKEFRFVEFSNVVASDFEAGLLVGKLSRNLSTHFGQHVYVFLNDLSFFPTSLRHHWRR